MARDATRVSRQRAEQSTWPLHRFVISPVSLSPLVERVTLTRHNTERALYEATIGRCHEIDGCVAHPRATITSIAHFYDHESRRLVAGCSSPAKRLERQDE